MSEPNPFILKDFIIVESPYTSNDCTNNKTSTLLLVSEFDKSLYPDYTVLSPMNILELEQYIAGEVNAFLLKARLARRCDNYVIQGSALPKECTTTFKNFPAIQSQFDIGDYVVDRFVYTDDYIKKQMNNNEKKPICHRLRDLKELLTEFNRFLQVLDTPEIKAKYPDQYKSIMTKYKENLNMRSLLDQKLDNIYSNESGYGNSKRYLDSTIYTSVLWTVLATTFIFYIFKKM